MGQTGIDSAYGRHGNGNVLLRTKDGNVLLYMTADLKEYRISMVDRDGKRIHLGQALNAMVQVTRLEDWNERRMFLIPDALYFMQNQNIGRTQALEFGAGFFCGLHLQRMITNRGVKLDISERDVSASEMDVILREETEETPSE